MALFPQVYLDSLVSIEKEINSEGFIRKQAIASAFLFGVKIDLVDDGGNQRYIPFIVTNRHVFEKKDDKGCFSGDYVRKLFFRFNSESAVKYYEVSLVDSLGQPIWLRHKNSKIDLAAFPIAGSVFNRDKLQYFMFTDDNFIFKASDFKEIGIEPGNGIFVLGFPRGIRGESKNRVIVRHGIISRVDEETIKENYFYIDAPAFPGNSGGPVISKPELISISGTKANNQSRLIGVISEGESYLDVAISQQTGRPRILFEESMGLIKIIPIDLVQEMVKEYVDNQTKKMQASKNVNIENISEKIKPSEEPQAVGFK